MFNALAVAFVVNMDDLHYSLDQDKDILLCIGKGFWKYDVAVRCVQSINTAAKQQDHKNFALIIDPRALKNLPPQGNDALHKALLCWVKMVYR